MDNVVYILGAGFSAPLGLPTMRNFVQKSKDLFRTNEEAPRHFELVHSAIRQVSVCKNYFEADLFNIEEILSILEMRESQRAGPGRQSFIDYISDVIRHYTPRMAPPPNDFGPQAGAWLRFIFGKDWEHYGSFVASLFNLSFALVQGRITLSHSEAPPVAYGVVSLNYDLVLEKICECLSQRSLPDEPVVFRKDFSLPVAGQKHQVPMAKLHGSIDTGEIVAPTWNKRITQEVASTWNEAHRLLSEANHIRILGYSLPISDAYVKYLLHDCPVQL